jgi:hypothetical protein
MCLRRLLMTICWIGIVACGHAKEPQTIPTKSAAKVEGQTEEAKRDAEPVAQPAAPTRGETCYLRPDDYSAEDSLPGGLFENLVCDEGYVCVDERCVSQSSKEGQDAIEAARANDR